MFNEDGADCIVSNAVNEGTVMPGRLSLDSCGSETFEDAADITAFSSSDASSSFSRIDGEEGIEEEVEEVFNTSPDNDLDIEQIEND